ncbi:MAG: HAD-IIB family hydrolase [Myxococcales bacterium]
MLPIAFFPPSTARALTGVCFDVDDTVTRHGQLEPAAYAALADLKDAGLKLIAVTGRPLGFAEVIARMWCVDAAIGENGAGYVAREGKGLRFGYWDDAATRAEQQLSLARIRARVTRELPFVQEADDVWARRCDLAFDVGERAQLTREQIQALVSLIEAEGAHSSVSSVHAHAQFGDHDKARGVARALHELWGLEPEQVGREFLFVGDSGNDAAAFAWFECTAGVANVVRHLDRLPRPPRFVAQRECGQGFAEIAAHILSARRAVP